MAARNDLTIDWNPSPRVITVLAPSTELTIQDLVDTCRDAFEDQPSTLQYPHLIDAAGKQPLGAGVLVGITATLQNAIVGFEARPGPSFIQVNINGGNLVALDSTGTNIISPVQTTAFTQVNLTSSSSATLQEQVDIQYASFDGAVHIDVVNGVSGVEYPTGTPRQPSNNIADAQSIDATRGISRFHVVGDLEFYGSHIFINKEIAGESLASSTFTFFPGCVLSGCEIYDATLTGDVIGMQLIERCLINELNGLGPIPSDADVVVFKCLFNGSLSIPSNYSGTMKVLESYSDVPGEATPTLNLNGAAASLMIRGYNGGLKVINATANTNNSIDMASGNVILDSTVTNGTWVVRGIGKITEGSTGAAVVDTTGLINNASISNDVWQAVLDSGLTAEEIMRLFAAVHLGKTTKVSTTLTFRDPADTKDRVIAVLSAGTDPVRTSVALDSSP